MERSSFVWELLFAVPMLRAAVYQIEELKDEEMMVGELLELYRGVDEMIEEMSALSYQSSESCSVLSTGG